MPTSSAPAITESMRRSSSGSTKQRTVPTAPSASTPRSPTPRSLDPSAAERDSVPAPKSSSGLFMVGTPYEHRATLDMLGGDHLFARLGPPRRARVPKRKQFVSAQAPSVTDTVT